jgi:hypothetical protein
MKFITLSRLSTILIVAGALASFAQPVSAADPVLVGAGDIADCARSGDEATAKLLDTIPGTVFTTGDNVYPSGTATEFANCYAPSWGRHKTRTRPAIGDHDYGQSYRTPDATPYFKYFGAAAGDPKKGYYSYNLGAWHIVVPNSQCEQVGGCEAGSPQGRWLRADLAAHPARCTLAYFHNPRFSSIGSSAHPNPRTLPLWQALYDAGAEVILNGDHHAYERFAPQDPNGRRDQARGIRQFIVGTGGAHPHPVHQVRANSEARIVNTFGVLKLTLHASSYDWQFIPVQGQHLTDSGRAFCH